MNKLLLSIILPTSLYLTACGGGGDSNSNSTTPTTPTTPTVNSSPMYTQDSSVYSFGTFSSQLNNRYTHTLKNNIINQEFNQIKHSSFINTFSSGNIFLVDKNKVYVQPPATNTTRGTAIPSNYFISDDGSTLTTSFYNSEGISPTIRTSMAYKRIDVSGMEVKKYIYKNLLTSTTNLTSAAALNASTNIFPQGSVVFIPGEYTRLDEYYELHVYQRVSYNSFEEIPDIAKYPLTRNFGGITIRYSDSTSLGYGQYNGKVYQTWHHPANSKEIIDQNNNYFYNSIAADAVANELISSCGTEKYNNSNSGCMF